MNLVPFRLHKGMFVAQVARKSIEPAIRGGAWRRVWTWITAYRFARNRFR